MSEEITESVAFGETLAWFTHQMARALDENSDKPGWRNDDLPSLLERVRDETFELQQALERYHRDHAEVVKEAADLANFAMMIADIARQAMTPPAGRRRDG